MGRRSFYLALAGFTLAPLLLLANGVPFLKDSGELTASLLSSGVAHPTGFSLQHVFAALAALLPMGAGSLRMAWVSALGAALALCLVTATVEGVLAGEGPVGARRGSLGRLTGILAACGLLLADTVFFHAVNVEVYVPSLAMSAALLFLALRAFHEEDRRWWHLLALAGGLSLGLHVTAVGLFGLAALLVAGRRLRNARGGRLAELRALLFPALLFGLAGALVTLYIPLRAAADPLRNWGNPTGIEGLLAHLSGRSIRTSFEGTMLQAGGALRYYLSVYGSQLGAQVGSWLPLVLLGVVATVRRQPWFGALLGAVLIMDAAFSVLVNPMGLVEKQTNTVSMLVLATWAGIGAAAMWAAIIEYAGSAARTSMGAVAAVLAMVLLLVSPALSLDAAGRRARTGRHGYGLVRGAFSDIPPEGTLVTSLDDLSALSIYFQEAEKRRPDVIHLLKQFVCDRSFRHGLALRHPRSDLVAAVLETADRVCAPGAQPDAEEAVRVWAALRQLFEGRRAALHFELGEGAVDRLFRDALLPDYPVFRTAWGLDPDRQRHEGDAFAALLDEMDRSLGAHFADDISRTVLSEYYRLTGTFLLQLTMGEGRVGRSCKVLAGATRLSPDNCRAWNNLAVCLSVQGRLEGAAEASGAGRAACPRYLTVRINEVRFLLQLGRTAAAERALGMLLQDYSREELRAPLERLAERLDGEAAQRVRGFLSVEP